MPWMWTIHKLLHVLNKRSLPCLKKMELFQSKNVSVIPTVINSHSEFNEIGEGRSPPDRQQVSISGSVKALQEPSSLSLCRGHLRAPTLYTARSDGNAPQHFLPIGQESTQPHASQCPPQEYIFPGTAHRCNFSTLAMRSLWDNETDCEWFPNISIRGPPPQHTQTHTVGFYLRDPLWSIDMCCYGLDVVN